jgi:endonuclease-3
MARATPEEVEPYIARLGLYRNKAKSIVATARILADRFDGEVPRTMEELTALPGVGRKTANVVMSNAFGIPAIAVDTHVFRVANRLGLAKAKTVEETEAQLMKVIPRECWSDAHHWLILHGRRVCSARRPACERCVLNDLCPSSTVAGAGDRSVGEGDPAEEPDEG